jgi:hypothetical protein
MGYAIELLFEDGFTEAIIDIWKKYNVNGYGIAPVSKV